MKENKLIAEFMGWKPNEHHWCLNGDKDLQYHNSWDWLMPVVDKYYEKLESMYEKDEWEWRVKLHEQLLDINLEGLHKVIVEFIQYKNQEL